MLKNKGIFFLGIIVLAIFAYGAVQLLILRLESGDVYPPYSSLRADPLGTKALYESLESCCGLKVQRNYEPFVESEEHRNATIFFLGINDDEMYAVPDSLAKDFRAFVEKGGRLVFTFVPRNETSLPGAIKKAIEKQMKREKEKEKKKKGDEEEEELFKMLSLLEEWGFEFANSSYSTVRQITADLKDKDQALPSKISCHTSLYFRNLDPGWRVMYERENFPVIVERRFGKGTIVLSSLSFFLSNEAMLKERRPDLLAWMVGNHPVVIFDEYHNGVQATPGVAALARKYQLEGLFFGILVLAILFLWKHSVSLVPPFDEADLLQRDGSARGKESSAGLTNLLRRNIPARQILSVCYQEWKKSPVSKGLTKNKVGRIDLMIQQENQLPLRQRDSRSVYNRISEILKERG